MTTTQTPGTTSPVAVAVASLHLMATGNRDDFETMFAPDAINRASIEEPPDTRGTGPEAFFATARWLRTAFSPLAWEVHDIVHDGDLVVIHATMSGRQIGPFVSYGPEGDVMATFEATGRTFAVTQSHWFRVRGSQITEHWANRDDLGMGMQLGWGPAA